MIGHDTPDALSLAEARKLFERVFGNGEGQKALMYILIKIGGIAQVRGFRPSQQDRAMLDGKREAALEIMALAGFTPANLVTRLMDLKPEPLKDLDHEKPVTQSRAAKQRRPRRAYVPSAAAISDAHDFGGDATPEPPAATGANAD